MILTFGVLFLISGVLSLGFDFDLRGVAGGFPAGANRDKRSICGEKREPGYPGEPQQLAL